MFRNPTTCGNCHTENPPDQDVCTSCGQPLARSAQQGEGDNQDVEDGGRVIDSKSSGLGGTAAPSTPGVGMGDDEAMSPD